MSKRVGYVYDQLLSGYTGRHLMVVRHGGVTRALVGRALRADAGLWYRIRIDYASMTRIRHDRFGASVQFVNARAVR